MEQTEVMTAIQTMVRVDNQLQLQQYNSKKGFITNKDEFHLNIGDSIGEDGKAGHYV